ncbi:uncharacterized protein LAJ45_04917 [Morchella importuna]|uniref:uncharacterized protein n=1 Tax=Morchella importuna TaxID=1174673 RepID=UPI001E8E30B5|nr:uncharacterized protein LAJ45_04917 [Morchella importuna]KAH8151215.1 hypothetical protein LAJ45_04917 [Morchella importuna]
MPGDEESLHTLEKSVLELKPSRKERKSKERNTASGTPLVSPEKHELRAGEPFINGQFTPWRLLLAPGTNIPTKFPPITADPFTRFKKWVLAFKDGHQHVLGRRGGGSNLLPGRRSQQQVERREFQVPPNEPRRTTPSGQRHPPENHQHVPSRPKTSTEENSDGNETTSSSSSQPSDTVIEEEAESEPTYTTPAPATTATSPVSAIHNGLLTAAGDSEPPHEEEKTSSELIRQEEIDKEIDWRWILNLSMHFRDQSDREKFFVTYAETPNLRRRLTVSCDYRDAPEGTLERELADMRYQRDKSAKIYEAIKESLPSIQFYETITNLKLKTSGGRLHVHVTEDIQEIIPYPPVVAIAHLRCPKYKESDLEFESHLSGFVYKVKIKDKVYIKKEIPGPDTVDEFLYEINALYALKGSQNVIRFGGCIVDERRQKVKGLLISFAPKGALIDIIYHEKHLPWRLREKWAKQIVSGLSEVHEAGYVQGDFTLSNIVIDENDDAKIIDINRRGCPLGMVLWGIAHIHDEPEAMQRPLSMDTAPPDVPEYFKNIVDACLCERPQGRMSAKDIIALFPKHNDGYVPRLGDGHRDEDNAVIEGAGTGNGHGYVIGEPDANGIVEVSLNGRHGGQAGESGYNSGVAGLLLNGRTSSEPDNHSSETFTHLYRPSESGHGRDHSEGSIGDHAHPEPHRINTQFNSSYEDLQVITASPGPSESGASGDEPFPWPSIHGAAFGAGTGPRASAGSMGNGENWALPQSRIETNTTQWIHYPVLR